MDDKEIRDVIGVIYEAASAPDQWGAIVRKIKRATRSHFGMLWLGKPRYSVEEFATNQGDFLAFEHADFSLSDFEDFVRRCQDPSLTEPYAQIAHRVPLGRAVVGHEFVPIDEFRKTEFHHYVAGPAGNVHLLGAITARNDGHIDAINFYRRDDATNYGRDEQRLLDVFIPHIRRSLNLYNKLQMAGAQTVLLETAIDTLATALVLLNQNGEVAFLNATAARLTRRCRELCVRRDKLYATRHADTLQLERLIKKATGANGGRPLGGAVAIQRTLGKQPLQVTAAPLPRDNRTTLASERRAVAVLMIHDPNEQTYVPQETIRTMFGLTPAEARLLLALSHGQTLKQYSEEQRVTHNTARTHVKSVFAKTRTSKQSDLVRLMSAFTYSATPSQR